MIFEVTLPGFDGDTDATDHLIKWISAPNIIAVHGYLSSVGIGILDCTLEEAALPEDIGTDDGVDLVLDDEGNVLRSGHEVDAASWPSQEAD
jgi:hypothetical protein